MVGSKPSGATTAGMSVTGGEGGTTAGGATAAETRGATTPVIADASDFLPEQNWPPDLCGLEDEGPEWKLSNGPKRIKESILTPEETKKCQEIIAQCYEEDTVLGARVDFDPDDVMWVLDKVKEYLKTEPMLIEDLTFPIQIVGDLHGQLYDLDRIFEADAKDGKKGWENSKYLFLGDYVDRGRQSIEIIMSLFCLKMLYPDRIFLLRGNHEFISTNSKYGFFDEWLDRYEDEVTADIMYHNANTTFAYLSCAAIVGDVYFCAHGGVAPEAFTRRQFRGVFKPILDSHEDILVHDVCWADPAVGLEGSAFNRERRTSYYFGLDQLAHALESMQVKVLVRAHTKVMAGFDVQWNCCVTIFSAIDSLGAKNKGATALINEDGKIAFRVFEIDEGQLQLNELIREWNKETDAVVDDVTVMEGDCDAGVGIKHF